MRVRRAILRSALVVALLSTVAVSAAAQSTFIVPSKAISNEPAVMWGDAAYQAYPFWGTGSTATTSRVQYLYDTGDIPVASASLNAVSFRPGESNANRANTFQTTILVSVGPNPWSTPDAQFTNNHGASVVQVFSGALSLPRTNALTWPTPWETPIPFAQPVPYSSAAGQSLVIEFQTTGASVGESWIIEGYREEAGLIEEEYYQNNCFNSAGNRSRQWGTDTEQLLPGGMFQLSLLEYPTNTTTLSANALIFALSGFGTQVGTLTTPFLLTDLGLDAPNNCRWAIDLTPINVPMTYFETPTTGYLRVSGISIPNIPSLGGAVFYTQNVALDLFGGQPKLFPSIAIQWTIGTGIPVPVGRVLALAPTLQASGIVTPSNGATLRFHY